VTLDAYRRMLTVLSATVNYRLLTENMTKTLERTAAKPDVARLTERYLEKVGQIKSIDAFLANDEVFTYAMKAHGLSDMTYAKAFMRKALEEGTDKSEAFVNKLVDKRYKEFVETFNFVRFGTATTSFERTQQGTVDKYLRQTVEEDAGAQDEGVRLALYFQRKAPSVTNVYGLLGDPALLKVTQTVLGLSEATGAMDIDKQAALIGKRLKVEDLKDPQKLDKLLNRFTSLWEVQKGITAGPGSATLALFGGAQIGINSSILASLQNLRLGG
jgi:hypothetical protein